MKIAILTDNSAVIDADAAANLDIKILALPLLLGQKVYYEGQDLRDGELFDLVNDSKETLNIASVSRKTLAQQMQTLADAGYTDVICIYLANGINALDENLRTYAKAEARALNVHLFDSHTTGLAQAKLVRQAAKLVKSGEDVAQILAKLSVMRDKTQTIVIDDIRNLRKTGYVSNGTPVVGNALLHLKTLLEFTDDGKLAVLDTSVRMKKAYYKVLEQINSSGQEVTDLMLMCDEASAETANKWLQKFQTDLPETKLEIARLKPSIRAHVGEKSLLVSWIYA